MKKHHFHRSKLADLMTWEHFNRLEHSYVEYYEHKHPNYKTNYLKPVKDVVMGTRPSNTIENAICLYGKWTGQYQAEKINNTGSWRPGIGYIPGRGCKGTADISATINGQSVKIEVKYGRDRQSEAQKQYQAEIEQAGGQYWIVRTFSEFLNKYGNYEKK